jgi:photosystem II stability/assembly factor-like uncharacterized protein
MVVLATLLLVIPIPAVAGPITPQVTGVPFCEDGNYCGWEWASVPSSFADAQTPLKGVVYVTSSVLVTVGYTGTILRSTDGGIDWSLVPSPLPSGTAFYSVVMVPGGLLLAGGQNGALIASSTLGASWLDWSSHGLKGNVTEMGFVGVTFGYAATSAGLYVTHDGAQNWTKLVLPVQGPALAAAFSTATTGWVDVQGTQPGQSTGTVFYTTNGGGTWDAITFKNYPSVVASTIVETGPTSAWILGDQGTVWYLTHGTHANVTQLATAQHTWTLAVVNNTYGWVSSDDANTFYTANSGHDWVEEGVPEIPEIYGMAFIDPEDGVAVGDGVIWYTTDGGLGGNDTCGVAIGNNTYDADSVPASGFSYAANTQSWPSADQLCYPVIFPDLKVPLFIIPALTGFVAMGVVAARTNWGLSTQANGPAPHAKELQEMKRRRKLRERHRYVRFR